MSNIYIQEPPTNGKVLLETTVGDIEIELWSKETPKACENFVQHCLNGYYNGTVFHRLVKGFIVQGGDPTGTGNGGKSIWGTPFKDEFHTRLRFVRRGLVAMANGGKDDNESQFFFTLGSCPELQNKHTLFGKIVGNTLYNMLKLEECMVDGDERPLYAHKIYKATVLNNPFKHVKEQISEAPVDPTEDKDKSSAIKASRNFTLLSFGEEAEEEEAEVDEMVKGFRSRGKSSHDLSGDPKLLASAPAVENEEEAAELKRKQEEELERIKKKLKKDSAKEEPKLRLFAKSEEEKNEELSKIKSEIKKIKKELRPTKEIADEKKDEKESEESELEAKNSLLAEFHNEAKKYRENQSKVFKKKEGREEQTLALLSKFKKRLSSAQEEPNEENEDVNEEELANPKSDNWLSHKLIFAEEGPVLAHDANIKKEEMYDINDPRNPMNVRRRESKKESRHRK